MKLCQLAAAALAVTLGLSLGTPALAEGTETADARLLRVTQTVKDTLSVPDDYTQFSGNPSETPLGTRWNLNWSGERQGLSVTATETGKVLSLDRWEETSRTQGGFGLSFPAISRTQARENAEAFLARVLTNGETASLAESGTPSLSSSSCFFSGGIALNGLPSPLRVQVRVRLSDGAVTSFWRDDTSDYTGALPAPAAALDAPAAAALLKTTLSLRLEYVRAGEGEPAVLRYLPESGHDFYVDAASGDLVDLTALREKLAQKTYDRSGNSASSPAEAAADGGLKGLTEAELAGAALLEGTLDKAALDRAIRGWKALGLSAYQLSDTRYFVNSDTGEVTARLTYGKNTELGIYRRTVTVDARTGALESMYSYAPYDASADARLTTSAAQAKGEAFLKSLWPGQFGETACYRPDDHQDGTVRWFTFAQKANGYFFPDNALQVEVSAVDGSITGFSRSFDDTVTFAPAENLISASAALDAWAGSFPVTLSYVAVPVELDLSAPEFAPLRAAGYRYFNALKPGYALGAQEIPYTGVDAQTGALVQADLPVDPAIRYDDLNGHWAQSALQELAAYQVGWLGGKARPDGALTQLDCVALLASAQGYLFDPETGSADDLYRYAFQQGILSREERADTAQLTRLDTVKLLLNSLGYGTVARLQGIYRCDFSDTAAIPAADLGYAALAQGLGVVSGDAAGRFAPARPASRAEAAVMLWNDLKRS